MTRSPMESIRIRARGSSPAWLVSVLAVAMLLLALPVSGSTVHAIQVGTTGEEIEQPAGDGAVPPRESADRRVYDEAHLLNMQREEGMESELLRASRLGVEIVAYTRLATDSPLEDQVFADALREEWAVESSPGANDGLVLLITYGISRPEGHTIVASWGEQAFPIRQLDEATFRDILDTEMRPAIEEGDFYLAFLFGIRRVLNFADYTPPEPPPLTATQETAASVARVATPVLLQVVVLGYALAGVLVDRRFTRLPSPRALGIYAVGLAIAAIVAGSIAIYGRHANGSLISLGTLLWAIVGVPALIGLSSRRHRSTGSTVAPTTLSRIRSARDLAAEGATGGRS